MGLPLQSFFSIQGMDTRPAIYRKTPLVKGLRKFTIEGAMIYLNSLLGSSILFAAEATYNLKENEVRLLERIEESLLRKIFDTGKGCPIYQLYFEAGHLPARIQIKRMKLVFYQYILKQDETSLLFRFLMSQKSYPRKGDWYSEVQIILKDFEIPLSEEGIKETKTNYFKKLVKQKSIQAGIRYLNSIQINKEKGRLIKYDELELQDYLQACANISFEDQKRIFSLRCEMNLIRLNFKRNINISPEYCIKQCQQELDNTHLTWCRYMNKENDFRFTHLLKGTLEEKIGTLNQIKMN